MKKFKLFLALLAASFGSVQGAWARTAPTLPTEYETLEDEGTYYLYNTKAIAFLGETADASNYGEKVTIYLNGTAYRIKRTSDNVLLGRLSNAFLGGGRWADKCGFGYSNNNWDIVQTNNEIDYYIRNTESSYMGYNNGEPYLFFNLGTGSDVEWRLVSETDVAKYEMYIARVHLYEALNATDGYGFDVTAYENIYSDSNSTIDEIENATIATKLILRLSANIEKHTFNDYPVTLYGKGWTVDGSSIKKTLNIGENCELSAIFNLPEEGTFAYKMGYGGNYGVRIFVDGVENKYISYNALNDLCYNYFYLSLPAGEHHITWKWEHEYQNSSAPSVSMTGIGVISTPQISVSLLEPGSLGTEVLNHVEHVKDVRNLKIKGKMNSDDWAKINMMTNLMLIDLGEAEITEIPASQFKGKNASGQLPYVYSVILPNCLKTINQEAFSYSFADVTIPSSVTTIGSKAFEASRITEADLSNIEKISDYAFNQCKLLKRINIASNLQTIGMNAFQSCYSLEGMIRFPESLSKIGGYAFSGCKKLNIRFSNTYISIGNNALTGTAIDSLIFHNAAEFVSNSYTGEYSFSLPNLVYAEFPVNIYYITGFDNTCSKLNTIRLNSPTISNPITNTHIQLSNIKLIVPDYLVNSYKLHSYWYNAKEIVGFDTSEIEDWIISQQLILNNGRLGGNPNITLNAGWKINGDATQNINNLVINRGGGMIIGNGDNITVNGSLTVNYSSPSQKWSFISLPFDVKVSEIDAGGAKYAIRYYDGVTRAQNGAVGNWKNYDSNAIIKAGTGFIIQTSIATNIRFTSIENDSKQYAVSNNEFVQSLDANISETPANKGWNFIGNPWECYYNIHKLNFTAPITTWNGSTYVAYSIIDDDYAIKPNEAFFVQCPDEVTEITFPTDGRQLTSVIESQNGARAEQPSTRKLIDIEITNGDLSDKTRVVLNDKANISYEAGVDASKFFSMDGDVPQIYSLDSDNNEYAINERPLADGNIKLRLNIQKDDTYTISAKRNDMEQAIFKDLLTGEETDLRSNDYTINLEAGVYAERFELSIAGNAVTEIKDMKRDSTDSRYYNLNGQQVEKTIKGIYIVGGKKVVVK